MPYHQPGTGTWQAAHGRFQYPLAHSPYQGRDFRLTDIHGEVVKPLLA